MLKEKTKKQKIDSSIEDVCEVKQEVDTIEIDTIEDYNLEVPVLGKEDIKEIEFVNSSQAIIVDRDEEDKDVETFQKTGDLMLLEKVYKNRIPTLKSWANRHYYPGLIASVEDLFEELSLVFVKASEKYDRKKGNFNNCLFIYLDNRLKNLKSSKYAKKRISEEYDGPISGMILSLDYSYNDKEGSELTLKDIISNQDTAEKGHIHKRTSFDETINILAPSNPLFKDFLLKISEGGSLASLLKEYKTKNGKVKMDHGQEAQLKNRKSKKLVSDIIRSQEKINGEFEVINYSLETDSTLDYEIEMKKTKETDNIMKTIRDLRKNKQSYVDRIRGEKVKI